MEYDYDWDGENVRDPFNDFNDDPDRPLPDEDGCIFDEDEECEFHHSYCYAPGECLWAAQHRDELRRA